MAIKRSTLLYLVDLAMAVCFVIMAFTGIVKFHALFTRLGLAPPAFQMKQMTVLHDWSGLALVILVFIHLAMHWRWIVAMTRDLLGLKEKK